MKLILIVIKIDFKVMRFGLMKFSILLFLSNLKLSKVISAQN